MLTRKAQEVCAALSLDDSLDYDVVNAANCEHMNLYLKRIGNVLGTIRKVQVTLS